MTLPQTLRDAASLYQAGPPSTRTYESGRSQGLSYMAHMIVSEAEDDQVRLTSRLQHQIERVTGASDRGSDYARGYLAGRREALAMIAETAAVT